MALLLIAAIVFFFGFAPWAAVQAVSGRWGVTATVLGVAFMVTTLWSLFRPRLGWLFGTSWGLYCTYLLGYWTLVGHLTSWLPDGSPAINSLDDYVRLLLILIGICAEYLALLSIATLCSFFLAYIVTASICKLRGQRAPTTLIP